jgi:outer membrane lipoprotein-sorting protein
MSDDCIHAKELIDLALLRPITPGEHSAIDGHCGACRSCRQYREDLLRDDALLGELTAKDAETVRQIERETIEAVTDRTPRLTRVRRRRHARPFLLTFVRIAAAAAAVVGILIMMDTLLPRQQAPPAFASVIETMEKADNVVVHNRYYGLGEWKEITIAEAKPHLSRRSYGDSLVVIMSKDAALELYPLERRAVLWRDSLYVLRGRREDPVDKLANYHKRTEFSFVRKERLKGRTTLVYEGKLPKIEMKITIWVDPSSYLPVQFAYTRPPGSKRLESYFSYGLRVEDFAPSGRRSSKITGWEDLKEGEPHAVIDLRWNQKLDPSYFSLEPPKGYTVEEHVNTQPIESLLVSGTASDVGPIVRGLKAWIELTGGRFPENISDLADTARVRSLLLGAFDKNGRPGDEYRAAHRREMDIWMASHTMERRDSLTGAYFGAGATPGDSTRIVCWIKAHYPPDSPEVVRANPYWIIFADFHCERSAAPPVKDRR